MWVLIIRLELTIPGARSRKDRRQAVKSLKERLMGTFQVSCSEVDDQESWVRAELGVSTCANDCAHLEELGQAVVRYASNDHGVILGAVDKEIFRYQSGAIEWPS